MERLNKGMAMPLNAPDTGPITESLVEGDVFYNGLPLPEDCLGPIPQKNPGMPLLRRLGSLPFWKGESTLEESLEDAYEAAARRGRAVVYGEE